MRKSALALVAAAGLVAWAGGARTVEAVAAGRAPIMAGQAALTALAHADGPALASGIPTSTVLGADSGERHHLRLGGGGSPRQPAAAPAGAASGLTAPSGAGDGRDAGRLARARAALLSAPSTGPPSFPS